MKIIVKKTFERDINRAKDKELRFALNDKITQIERAKNITQVTGLKLLRGYTHHYRIIVKAGELSFRIGAIIRGETIWLVRFLPRKIVYKRFP